MDYRVDIIKFGNILVANMEQHSGQPAAYTVISSEADYPQFKLRIESAGQATSIETSMDEVFDCALKGNGQALIQQLSEKAITALGQELLTKLPPGH